MNYDEEYYCPNCDAILNDQVGFDPNNDTWRCLQCGKELYGDEIYSGENYPDVIWRCDNCGAILNKQYGFSDNYESWECTNCFHENRINEDCIYDSEEDYQNSKTVDFVSSLLVNATESFVKAATSAVKQKIDEENRIEYDKRSEEERKQKIEEEKIKAKQEAERKIKEEKAEARHKKRKTFRKKHWKAYFVLSLVLCLTVFGAYKYWQLSKLRIVGVSSYSVIDKNYEEIENILTKAGFKNIVTIPERDLDGLDLHQECFVSEITINNRNYFDKEDKFPYDSEIIIRYHSAKTVDVPLSSKKIKGMNYNDIKQKLEDLGFVDIELKKDEDLIFGWIHKDGEIESISIDGNKNFDENYNTRIDSKIIITYHTYKSKK